MVRFAWYGGRHAACVSVSVLVCLCVWSNVANAVRRERGKEKGRNGSGIAGILFLSPPAPSLSLSSCREDWKGIAFLFCSNCTLREPPLSSSLLFSRTGERVKCTRETHISCDYCKYSRIDGRDNISSTFFFFFFRFHSILCGCLLVVHDSLCLHYTINHWMDGRRERGEMHSENLIGKWKSLSSESTEHAVLSSRIVSWGCLMIAVTRIEPALTCWESGERGRECYPVCCSSGHTALHFLIIWFSVSLSPSPEKGCLSYSDAINGITEGKGGKEGKSEQTDKHTERGGNLTSLIPVQTEVNERACEREKGGGKKSGIKSGGSTQGNCIHHPFDQKMRRRLENGRKSIH